MDKIKEILQDYPQSIPNRENNMDREEYMKNIKFSVLPYCPLCSGEGRFVEEDRITWFRCATCGYQTRAKSYRDEIERSKTK